MSDSTHRQTVGVIRETLAGETRVSLIPAVLAELAKSGMQAVVETGAGAAAGFPDDAYAEKGAQIVESFAGVFSRADIVVQVRAGGADHESHTQHLPLWRAGQSLVAMCDPLATPEVMAELAARRISIFALELIPRITRNCPACSRCR
jgi:H+-translocating NAD(P) transhydrogenase subunit alpha